MSETLYEISWHVKGDILHRVTADPVEVLEESILPGCSRPSILVVDHRGHKFRSSRRDYYASEEVALEAAVELLQQSIAASRDTLSKEYEQLYAYERVLAGLLENEKTS